MNLSTCLFARQYALCDKHVLCKLWIELAGESVHLPFCKAVCFNPLTTDDAIWRRLTLAACYQLAQSVLKIGFVLAKKAG